MYMYAHLPSSIKILLMYMYLQVPIYSEQEPPTERWQSSLLAYPPGSSHVACWGMYMYSVYVCIWVVLTC